MTTPRKGDAITWAGEQVGIVSEVDGDICWYRRPSGESNCFIWRFRRAGELNSMHDWPGKDAAE